MKNGKNLGILLDQNRAIKGLVPGGSAHACGKLLVGDELIRVDGRGVGGMTVSEVTELITKGIEQEPVMKSFKPVGAMSPSVAQQRSGKPCGIGLTILDDPPHLVTYIHPNGPAARSHAIREGDCLVAIDQALVADLPVSEIVKFVVGEEGSSVELWLERVSSGCVSYKHHEKAEEIRQELKKLESLRKDGVLDSKAYNSGVERCWKGCYSVRIVRGMEYSGSMELPPDQQSSAISEVVLEFYRKSSDREISVVLPRPVREQSPAEDAASEGSDRPAAASAREGKLSRENSQGEEQDESHESSRNGQDWREEERNNRMISQFSKEVEVVAFVNSGKQLGLVFDQGSKSKKITIKAFDSEGTASRASCIHVGDELMAVDGANIQQEDLEVVCSKILQPTSKHVELVLARPVRQNLLYRYAVLLPRPSQTADMPCSCAFCEQFRGDLNVPEDTKNKQVDLEPAAKSKEDKEQKRQEPSIGDLMLGGLISLFSPSKPSRASHASSSAEAEKKRIAALEAAEKLPQLLARKDVCLGCLFFSDDTDTYLFDSRWRTVIDEDDKSDSQWLFESEDS
uniref:PDZ domain-containing protein n=1 Tax=Guillardia theta TaxID=55529 RepID=A0A7S4PHL6_GUITH|mmetsp:Transcript_51219/g.160003  ORF Transcript_51219/g.160003 Transcript_51219/m.160003 type:complete len:570 (+) Transcript_51219:196-1905(+)